MLIYKDVFGGKVFTKLWYELFSDSYPINLKDDLIYEVEGKTVTLSDDIDEALIGGNKAQEAGDEDEGVDSSVVTGINIILTHKYTETSFDKKQFKDWLREYMKKLAKKVAEKKGEDAVKTFQKGMQAWAMDILKKFDEYKFWLSENMPDDGMIILMGYREDQITPYFMYFKDGLEEEKF